MKASARKGTKEMLNETCQALEIESPKRNMRTCQQHPVDSLSSLNPKPLLPRPCVHLAANLSKGCRQLLGIFLPLGEADSWAPA